MISNLDAWRRRMPEKNIIAYAKGRAGAKRAVAVRTLMMLM